MRFYASGSGRLSNEHGYKSWHHLVANVSIGDIVQIK